jgi:hypothetical protein
MPNPHHSSDSVEHFTPVDIVERARQLMGLIDLDPASTKACNAERIHAKRYYTKEDNGLTKRWSGRVFLNPPGGRVDEDGKPVKTGGRSSAKVWWQQLARRYCSGSVKEAIFIGFSIELLQSCQVGDVYGLPTQFPICIPHHRIAFDTHQGKKWVAGKQPTHANVIVYLPPNMALRTNVVREFRMRFDPVGACMVPLVWILAPSLRQDSP